MSELNLRPEDIDRLGQALLTLTGELWIVKDRLRVLEAVLQESGIVVPEAVDQFEPGEALQSELATDRTALIERILDTLAPERD